jgi:uncharacterized membrane protein YfcA
MLDLGTILPLVVLFILGFLTGGLSNVTSGGAGIFTIYFLTNYEGLVIQDSTGTVLAASTIMVLVGAISFYRKRQLDTQLAITVGISGVISAFFAARWASTLQSGTLEEAFGGFTLVLAFYTALKFTNDWRNERSMASAQTASTPSANLLQATSASVGQPSRWAGRDPAALAVQIAKGALIGAATGLFGVGLASLSVVLFFLLFKLDTKVILGTSLFASFFRYLGGAAGYLTTGEIDPFYFAILVIGGGIGSFVGARILLGGGRGSNDIYVKIIVVGILVFISYEFLLKHLL